MARLQEVTVWLTKSERAAVDEMVAAGHFRSRNRVFETGLLFVLKEAELLVKYLNRIIRERKEVEERQQRVEEGGSATGAAGSPT